MRLPSQYQLGFLRYYDPSVFSNGLLPPSSREQTRAMTIAFLVVFWTTNQKEVAHFWYWGFKRVTWVFNLLTMWHDLSFTILDHVHSDNAIHEANRPQVRYVRLWIEYLHILCYIWKWSHWQLIVYSLKIDYFLIYYILIISSPLFILPTSLLLDPHRNSSQIPCCCPKS